VRGARVVGIVVHVHRVALQRCERRAYLRKCGPELRADHDALGLAHSDGVRENVARELGVQQARDRADLVESVDVPQIFGPIFEHQRDHVAALDAHVLIGMRVAVDQRVGLGVGVP
jgi:hypothetical protein